jgi:hypothetical protein
VNRKAILCLLGGLTMLSGFPDARASAMVLADQTLFVTGSQATATPLNAPGAGELSVTLTDMDFPSPFASLQFALADTGSSLTATSNASTMSLDLTAPITVYADVFASSQAGGGLYNLTATFTPTSAVPLPPSAASLAAGLLVMLLTLGNVQLPHGRKSTQATVTTSMA